MGALGPEVAQGHAGEDALLGEGLHHGLCGDGKLDHGLVEVHPAMHGAHPGQARECREEGAELAIAVSRHPAQSLRAQQRHVDGAGGHEQALVGTDV